MRGRPLWAFKAASQRPIKVGREYENETRDCICRVNHVGAELTHQSLEIFSIEFNIIFFVELL